MKIINEDSLAGESIYIFWHSKMLAGWWIIRKLKPVALVSLSKDGELLSNVLKKWKYKIIRGSSSRGGKSALEEITGLAKLRNTIAITPDGPRGPEKVLKNGALIISFESGMPVVPLKIEYSRKLILKKSWDKFEIPIPFSKCTITAGKRYFYEKYLDAGKLKDLKNTIAGEMEI